MVSVVVRWLSVVLVGGDYCLLAIGACWCTSVSCGVCGRAFVFVGGRLCSLSIVCVCVVVCVVLCVVVCLVVCVFVCVVVSVVLSVVVRVVVRVVV